MTRGDLVTVASSGGYCKPRPALVMQADAYGGHPSVTVLPLTSELHDMLPLQITVEPGGGTGLRLRSQMMLDKATTISCAKAGARIGRLDEHTIASVGRAFDVPGSRVRAVLHQKLELAQPRAAVKVAFWGLGSYAGRCVRCPAVTHRLCLGLEVGSQP